MGMAEKRGHLRVPVKLTAHCRLGNRYVRDAVADLSQGGLYLRTKEPAKAGTPVRVALALPYKEGPRFCTLVGNVARIDRDENGRLLGLGVCFEETEMSAVDMKALHGFLEIAPLV
ncbi:MAG: PilZ domain-containing protein [Myxococcaceae bacterium]|nr:PilZ domain-containing protein [Myxococcaceae bacterium]